LKADIIFKSVVNNIATERHFEWTSDKFYVTMTKEQEQEKRET